MPAANAPISTHRFCRRPIYKVPAENWSAIHVALSQGHRGLPGGSSLAKLFAEHRGVRNIGNLPQLTIEQILEWADAHQARTGKWPGQNSGAIDEAPGETWSAVHQALRAGVRGLRGGSSLAALLAKYRAVRNKGDLPALTLEQILEWTDAYFEQNGKWPNQDSGPVYQVSGETWSAIDQALIKGGRGLSGGLSLSNLLSEHRGTRNRMLLPPLTVEEILEWADAHKNRTGIWPTKSSGPVLGTNGESWNAVSLSLRTGRRGLPGGSSLARLLAINRGVRNSKNLPPLTAEQILDWADKHFEHTGDWPTDKSGTVHGAPDEIWSTINAALGVGRRGLPGGSTLTKLLAKHRGLRNIQELPSLTVEQILEWANAHHERTRGWPQFDSGSVHGTSGETWRGIDHALRRGSRDLSGGSSLARLLNDRRANSSS